MYSLIKTYKYYHLIKQNLFVFDKLLLQFCKYYHNENTNITIRLFKNIFIKFAKLIIKQFRPITLNKKNFNFLHFYPNNIIILKTYINIFSRINDKQDIK